MKKKVCIITGSRAEYGLLKPLMDEFKNDKRFEMQIIATGMHLSKKFGLTYKEIENNGFKINKKVDIKLESDTSVGIANSIGLGVSGFAKAYQQLNPDLIIVLGDRFEILAAAIAAHVSRIPIAHIHGGEVTMGAFDDAFRHAITKMSSLHFTSSEEYRKRVIQLGEEPKRVFNVGAIGLDNIKNLKLLSKEQLERDLNFKFNKHNLLITFHPVTLETDTSELQFQNLICVLDELKDTFLIFTKANADTNGLIINWLIDQYVKKNKDKVIAFTTMGQLRYLSTMQYVDALIGNSSSGIIEAPSFKIGTINIGDRQKGRFKADSIIDCEPTKQAIRKALNKLYSTEFKNKLKKADSSLGNGHTAEKIKKIISNCNLDNILKKIFFDIKFKL